MSWLRFGDEWTDSPTIAALPDPAVLLHIAALSYCTRYDTDGHLPAAAMRGNRRWSRRNVAALTDAGLWQPVPSGFVLADYEDHCRTLKQKQTERDRVQEWRDRKKRRADA